MRPAHLVASLAVALACLGCGAPAGVVPSPAATAAAVSSTPEPTSVATPTVTATPAPTPTAAASDPNGPPSAWVTAICGARADLAGGGIPTRDEIEDAFTLLDNVSWKPGETVRAKLREAFEFYSDAELADSFGDLEARDDALLAALGPLAVHGDAVIARFGSAAKLCGT